MIRRLGALVGGLLALGLLLAAPALAHAEVVASDPADGARLPTAPHSVTVTFDEGVRIGGVGYLHVTDEGGSRVDARAAWHPAGDAAKITVELVDGLGDGTYTASFRVVSDDAHPVTGTIWFVVGAGPLRGGVGGATSSVDPVTGDAFVIVRWISFAGLACLGGGWLLLIGWPAGRDDRRARRIVWGGWSALALGALLELLLQGPYTAGAGLAKVTSGSLLDDTLHSRYGQLHLVRVALLAAVGALLAGCLRARARPAWWTGVAGALGAAVAWTFSGAGHPVTTSPAWLSVSIDALHLLSMAIWVGGLVMVAGAVLPRRDPDELRAVLRVFSPVAFAAVTVLVASGTYSAFRGVGSVAAVFTTNYGWLVIGKVVLLAGILAVANLARRLVRARTLAYALTDAAMGADVAVVDEAIVAERLRRSIVVEAVAGLAVLVFSAMLVAQPRGEEALHAAAGARIPAPGNPVAPGAHRPAMIDAVPGTPGPVIVSSRSGADW